MAGSARTVFTRLLPWAALALMTVMFFVQVKARRTAEEDAAKAVGDLHVQRVDRALGMGPSVEPLEGAGAESAEVAEFLIAYEAELGGLRKQVEAARDDLASARSAQQAAVDKAERTEALRATANARADALEAQAAAAAEAAQQRVTALEAQLKDAQAQAARRPSPVARWLQVWGAGGADRENLRKELAQATPEDVTELRALWDQEESGARVTHFLGVLGSMPVTKASAALAAEIASCEPSCDAETLRPWVALAGPHLLHVDAFLALLPQTSHRSMRHVLVEHAAASPKAWSDEDRARIAPGFAAYLGHEQPEMVRFALRAITRLKLPVVSARVLGLLDHPDASVRIAAIYFLHQTGDGASAVKVLGRYVADLLDSKDADTRMAALFLAQELVGETRSLAFGSSQEAVGREIGRLKKKLGTLAKD